jgi:uncharacterized delta-60 repeat protein
MSLITALKRLPAAALLIVWVSLLIPSAQSQVIIIPGPGGTGTTNYTATNTFRFQLTNYFAQEDSIQALITVVREGSLTNADLVRIEYTMIDGTAISGTHYFKQSSTLVFFPGENRRQFPVPLIDNYNNNGNVSLTLILQNPGSGTETFAALGQPSIATLTIVDDESSVGVSDAGLVEIAPGGSANFYAAFVASEVYIGTREEWRVNAPAGFSSEANFEPYGPAGIEVAIVRKGGSRGKILVDWQTTTNTTPLFDQIFGFGGFFFFNSGGVAVPFDDFIPTNGTVALDDYQMATNVLIRLPADQQPEPWQTFSTNRAGPPVTFAVRLTGVRAHPDEAGQNVNPTLGTAIERRVAVANIDSGFSFTRLHYAVREGQRFVRVRVRRSLDEQGTLGGVHVHYVVNATRIVVDEGGNHLDNTFPLEAGSDYSTPFLDYEPPGSTVWRATMAAERAAGRAQVQDDEAPRIDWGQANVDDRYLVIPLIDDNGAEFNEDMQVFLYKHDGETDGFINFYASSCTIKILDNDQPGGASEVSFNPDVNFNTDPPRMVNPGANNTVQALVVQPDGKAIIGGDFSTYNTYERNGVARLHFNGAIDHSFNPGTGVPFPGYIRALALQPDGKVLIGGEFDSFNGTPQNDVARLLQNGQLDRSFTTGLGADRPIRTVVVQPDGKILIGGDFTSFDGTNVNYFARLNSNGRLDSSFNPGRGPNGPVHSIAVSTGGPIEIIQEAPGGPPEHRYRVDTGSTRGSVTVDYDFRATPDNIRIYYAGGAIYDSGMVSSNGTFTVNYAGTTDTFLEIVMNEGLTDPPAGANWYYKLLITPEVDLRPVLGGEFTEYDGVPRNFITRVNVDGTLDQSFDPGSGADDVVYSVAKLGNKVVLAGNFKIMDLQERRGIARLTEDGSLDLDFDPGTGFDNAVFSLAIQNTGKPLLGGIFRSFNQTRRVGLARLNWDGSLDTTFMDQAKNQFAGVPNPLSPENIQSQENSIQSLMPYRRTNVSFTTSQVVDTNNVTNTVITTNVSMTDHVFIGGRFSRVGGGFGRGEIRPRANVARLNGGSTPGPGNIMFASDRYSVNENDGTTFITLTRTNGSLAPISARFDARDVTAGPGAASAGIDYGSTNHFPIWIRSHQADRQYSDAYMGPNFRAFTTNRDRGDNTIYAPYDRPEPRYRNYEEDNIFVSIFDDTAVEGTETIALTLTTPDEGRLLLGGQPIPVGTALGRDRALLAIADNDFSAGTLGFSDLEYFVNENGTNAVISVTRVGGSSGPVEIDVVAMNGTANSADYGPFPRRTLRFAGGQTSVNFNIPIKNDIDAELEETVFLVLTNASGFPASIPPSQWVDPSRSNAVLNILDDDFTLGRISFAAGSYTNTESGGEVTITVRRNGGNRGEVRINYRTEDGTAVAGEDYEPQQNVLHWADGDSSPRLITIRLLNDDVVEAEESFNLVLFNASDPRAIGSRPATTIVIQNEDAVGAFTFSQSIYNVDENAPYADITVIRQGGISGTATVRFAATNLTAVGTTNATLTSVSSIPDFVFPEYIDRNGFTNILTFVEGQTAASFRIPIIDDPIVESDKRIQLTLFDATDGALLGPTNSVLVIIDDELNNSPAGLLDTTFESRGSDDYIYALALQNDGRILAGGDFTSFNGVSRNRMARLNPNGTLDSSFNPRPGPNDSIRTMSVKQDGRVTAGGLFTNFNGAPLQHLVRLNIDSSVDSTFNPGAGTDNQIFALLEQPDGKVLIVGNFSKYRGIDRLGIARVHTNGVLDASFNPGTGANGTVWAVALQQDGKILIGGDFTTFNNIPRVRVARLNRDGSLDTTFGALESGPNNSVRVITVQSDGSILIGGLFTTVNGRPYNRIARLNATGAAPGSLDTSFHLGFPSDVARSTNGANGVVTAIALQIDGKILVGGDFTIFSSRTRNGITRLNSDGSLDPTINFGLGANGAVSAIVVQPDRRIIIAGGFTMYDGIEARRIARIHGGALAGSGAVQFTSSGYTVNESDSEAAVTIRRTGGTLGPLSVTFLTATNETAIPGVDFTAVTNVVEFAEAETIRSVRVPVRRNTNALTDRFVNLVLTNVVNGTLGTQPTASLKIVNNDSQLAFSQSDYSVTESLGAVYFTIKRLGSVTLPLTVTLLTQADTATAGVDFAPVNTPITFAPGESARTVSLSIFDDTLVEGNERFFLLLTNVIGSGTIVQDQVPVFIIEDDSAPGQIEFASASFFGTEGSRQVIVRFRRVGGTSRNVSVEYSTRSGGDNPAQTPSDYVDQSGIVSFNEGVSTASFVVPVFDDQLVEGNETFLITISKPTGGATILGSTQAIGVIVDDDLPSGSLDHTFNPGAGANGEVRVVTLNGGGRILIGGDFFTYDNVGRSRVARLLPEGALDLSFDPGVGPNGTVADIELDPAGNLILGGGFNTVQNHILNRVARLSPDGNVDLSFNLPLGLNAEVSEVVRQPDGKILIGGMFDMASAAGRNHIARLHTNGTVDIDFNPGLGANENVYAIALQSDGKVLIGGAFSTINNLPRTGIARLNANGSLDAGFSGTVTGGPVRDILLLQDGRILIVGNFTAVGGTTRTRVAVLNSDGSLDQSFDPGPGPNGIVYAVAQQPDGKLLIAGDFTRIGGDTRTRIARLNLDGSHDLEFRPGGADNAIRSLVIQPDDGKILIAGRFTLVDNEPRRGIARLNNDKTFITPLPVEIAAISRVNGHLEFRVSTQAGFTYTLESTSAFGGSGLWRAEQTTVAQAATTVFSIIPSQQYQFFRVRRE